MQRDADQSQRYVDESHDQSTTDRRVTVAEAARILGISPEAVRARIQRGTLPKEKDPDGTVYVWLDADRTRSNADGTSDRSTDQSADQTRLITSLEEQISFLRAELVNRDQELAEMRRLLAGALERIPELEPAREPQHGPEPGSEASGKGDGSADAQEPSEHRSWLRRFFFGP